MGENLVENNTTNTCLCQTLHSVYSLVTHSVRSLCPGSTWEHVKITFIEGHMSGMVWALFTAMTRCARLIRQVQFYRKCFIFLLCEMNTYSVKKKTLANTKAIEKKV